MQTIILAGGAGKRLWPLSREYSPKQFLKLSVFGNYSLFQLAFKRALNFSSPEEILIVTNKKQKFLVMGAIEELKIDFPEENILIEPKGKNTLPAICYAMKKVKDKAIILPSDQYITKEDEFKKTILNNLDLADNSLVVFGLKPTFPHTGYGYIKHENGKVVEFKEKPNKELAEEYIKNAYLWNSGIFLFSKKIFENELKKYKPKIYEIFEKEKDIKKIYENVENISVDYGIMEKSKNVAVVELESLMQDLGSFDMIYDTLKKESEKNMVLSGEGLFIDSENNLVRTDKNKLISLCGIKDIVVIDTIDSLVITKKGDTQRIKEIVSELDKKGDSRIDFHKKVYRPWGSFTILDEGKNYLVKRLSIFPEKSISLQFHKHRNEHWVVVKGKADILLDEENFILKKNESIYVPSGSKHRLTNKTKEILEVIEVQTGESLTEEDIIRLEDNYGRV